MREQGDKSINRLGCWFDDAGACFRIHAPQAQSIQWVCDRETERHAMQKEAAGTWFLTLPDFKPGGLYRYLVDGKGPFPDPVSRFQPHGVHGPSQGIDLRSLSFHASTPPLPSPAQRIIYELHVGTFTPEGTFRAAMAKLPYLQDLGVTCLELMPIAEFPGGRGWGYDGVSLFAPSRNYGTPEDLVAFVDKSHALGLSVLLDVVYNHFGPDGNYLGVFSAGYFNPRIQTPWGSALNFDGEGNEAIRHFFYENALQWLRDYRFDGLRLDATHAICDDSQSPFLSRLRHVLREKIPERDVLIYAEDHRNPNRFCLGEDQGGFAFDGVWADDLHHHLRRHTAGDNQGYYKPFDGSLANICKTLEGGWFRDGSGKTGILAQGSDPQALDYSRFVVCLQNHDQIGNRALGGRLHHEIPEDVYRALSALLLLAPETPLLFMGQEWACSSPFLYFTDHHPELGALVTEGRRKEFAGFTAFADEASRRLIPDPQAESTWKNSRLPWSELSVPRHDSVRRFYRALLTLRKTHPALQSVRRGDFSATPAGETGLILERRHGDHRLLAAICLRPQGGEIRLPPSPGGIWRPHLTSEDQEPGSPPGRNPMVNPQKDGGLDLRFSRAGAWIAVHPS